MSLPVPRRKAAALALAATGLATVLVGAFAPAAHAAPTSASAKTDGWFKDPRTPAQRKAQVAVPKKPSAYRGGVKETRAVYRTKAGALAVPMRFAFGHTVAKGQAVTLDGNGLFVVNTTVLTTSARSQIRKLAVALEDASSVRCEGYADYAGTAKRNNVLARDRAARVCDFLVSINTGLKATTVSYGPTWPAVIGGDSEARKLNRRVVVEMTGTRPVAPPAPQTKVPGAPVLEHVNGYGETAYFAWSKPTDDGGSPITGYEVTTGAGWTPVNLQLPRVAKNSLCRGDCGDFLYGYVEGLTPGSTVDLRVRALNAIGAGAPSNTLSTVINDVPSAPTGLEVIGDDGVITTSFGLPVHTNGSPIQGYTISYDGGTTALFVPVTGNGPWTVVEEGFDNGTIYDVRVRWVNDFGVGPAASLEALVATVPGAPSLSVARYDGTDAVLSFAAPESDGGTDITSYDVTLDGETWTTAEATEVEPDVFEVTVTGLQYGDVRHAQVRAVNARGHGPASEEVEVAPTQLQPNAPVFLGGWTWSGHYDVSFQDGEWNGVPWTGYELSVNNGPWLPLTVYYGGPSGYSATAEDPGCASTDGVCSTTTGRIRVVTETGASEPSNVAAIYLD